MTDRFWETKALAEMTRDEWESLCDGCGKCCMLLLEDEQTGEVWETDIACRLFDCKTRRCTDYTNRSTRVPDCVTLTPDNVGPLVWMPETCAYRLLADGQPLADWHPLISGDPQSVRTAGVAAPRRPKKEADIPEDALWDRAKTLRCRNYKR